jgi:CheY-like chemotaxis protein
MSEYPRVAPSAQTPIARLKVLLVEDDPDGREMVDRLLRDNGAQVVAVDCAERAVQALRERSLDVMVSDIGMPDVDGYELLRRARQEGIDIPAVALTAFARPEDRARALEVGYTSHISKPIEPGALIAAIAAAARERGIERR